MSNPTSVPTATDKRTDWLRTVVPVIWSALIAWLIKMGAPEMLTDALNHLGGTVVTPVVVAAVYGALKALESHLPPWLSKILMGSEHEPEFPTKLPYGKHAH